MRRPKISPNRSNGLFTLHANGIGTSTGNWTMDPGQWILAMSQTSANISVQYIRNHCSQSYSLYMSRFRSWAVWISRKSFIRVAWWQGCVPVHFSVQPRQRNMNMYDNWQCVLWTLIRYKTCLLHLHVEPPLLRIDIFVASHHHRNIFSFFCLGNMNHTHPVSCCHCWVQPELQDAPFADGFVKTHGFREKHALWCARDSKSVEKPHQN